VREKCGIRGFFLFKNKDEDFEDSYADGRA
jgi:hypothetical protein